MLNQSFADQLASRIVNSGLEAPAIFFLELHKPLATFGGLVAAFVEPLAMPFFGAERVREFRELIEDRDRLEQFIRCIESKAAAKRHGWNTQHPQ
jgi:hypothetical protein